MNDVQKLKQDWLEDTDGFEDYGCPPDPDIDKRIDALMSREVQKKNQAQGLLCHCLKVTTSDGVIEISKLVDCLVEAAHARTMTQILAERNQKRLLP